MDFSRFSTLIANFNEASSGFWALLNSGCYLIGATFALLTGWQLKEVHESRGQKSHVMVITTFMTAVVFLYMPSAIATFSETAMTGSSTNPLAEPGTNNNLTDAMKAVATFVQMVGFIAFARGWMILRSIGHGRANEGASGRAIFHMVGGIACINILLVAPAIAAFVGMDSLLNKGGS